MVKMLLLGKHHYTQEADVLTPDGFLLKTQEVYLADLDVPEIAHEIICRVASIPPEFNPVPREQIRMGHPIRQPIWFDLPINQLPIILEELEATLTNLRPYGDPAWEAPSGRRYLKLKRAIELGIAWLALFEAPGQSRTVRYIAS
jgi:hypothetical protein